MKNWRTNPLLRMVARGCIFYALFCAAIFLIQRALLFYPSHDEPTGHLDAWRADGEIIGYSREVSNPGTVWLMMHGNAGQASNRDYVLDRLPATDTIYVLEYPGYGARAGKPSRASFDLAAQSAYDRLAEMYPDTPLGVIGESIGSGPAATLAKASRPPEKIVLLMPFDTLHRVAAQRFFFLPVWLLLRDRWDNLDSLQNYDGPVDIFCATQDTIIPCVHARNLARHVANATYQEIPGGHNDWSFQPKVKIKR